jgi:hypothetical protein
VTTARLLSGRLLRPVAVGTIVALLVVVPMVWIVAGLSTRSAPRGEDQPTAAEPLAREDVAGAPVGRPGHGPAASVEVVAPAPTSRDIPPAPTSDPSTRGAGQPAVSDRQEPVSDRQPAVSDGQELDTNGARPPEADEASPVAEPLAEDIAMLRREAAAIDDATATAASGGNRGDGPALDDEIARIERELQDQHVHGLERDLARLDAEMAPPADDAAPTGPSRDG